VFLVFPYRDENATIRAPLVTIGLIALNGLAWILVQGAGLTEALPASVCNLGLIPGELTGAAAPGSGFEIGQGLWCLLDPGRAPEHIFTSMFLHGGWQHLLGNMWFLWLTGNNIEDSMGKLRFLAFYLLCGIGAAAAQVLVEPGSVAPMVGASGAISGVMGAYLILFPRVRVYTLVWIVFFITTIVLPAATLLVIWIGLQVLDGLSGVHNGVAVWAHIGGFLAGVALIKLFVRSDYLAQHRAHHWRPRRLGMRRDQWR
jgi:membrane associated rhomboid family serine protease